jgi:hypothetical protein
MNRHALGILLLTIVMSMTVSCTSGGGGGGIGGSGIVAQGTITGFGSIYVNGIEYETDTASVEINEQGADASALKLGMVATVAGDVNADGVSGTADSVDVDNILRGPIAVVNDPDSDDVTRTVDILGFTVTLDRNDTLFGGTTFDTITAGNLVEVSGFPTSETTVQATRVQLTSSSEVELSGTVSGFNGSTFTLGAITVMVDGNTQISGPALANDQIVEVEGTILSAGPPLTILASEIEPEDDGLPDDAGEVEIEGIVLVFNDSSNFTVGGVTIDAATAEFEPATLATTLGVGDRVEVEGDMQNGVLTAEEVKGRGGDIRIEAFVSGVDAVNRQVTLRLAPLTPPAGDVTIDISDSTIFKDDLFEESNFGLGDLIMGDYVIIRADQTSLTTITANEIQRKGAEDEIKITAVVGPTTFANPDGTISLLGVTFDTVAGTEFEQDAEPDDLALTASQFFNNAGVMAGTARITIEDELQVPGTDTVGDGIADEVEIED